MNEVDATDRNEHLSHAEVLQWLEESRMRIERDLAEINARFSLLPPKPPGSDFRNKIVEAVGSVIVAKRKAARWFNSMREDIAEHVKIIDPEEPK